MEIDAGPGALLRQFHSGLTNQRADAYGTDRLLLTRAVLAAVRAEIGTDRVLALRLSCDELAPWAGVTPEIAAEQAGALARGLDLLTVVRGGPYSASAYRPDGHTAPMFNLDLTAAIRAAAGGAVPVVLQGSVVDPLAAQAALDAGAADLVEMTRALIADGELVRKLRAGHPERIRPCILCNQKCRVRDARNPLVSCVADPRSGHELTDRADPAALPGSGRRPVLVVGGGPAGLEAARVAASAGHPVRLAERSDRPGGVLRAAAVGPARERMARLADWLEAECRRLGVTLQTCTEVTAAGLDAARAAGAAVILATGGRPAPPGADYGGTGASGAMVRLDALEALAGREPPAGPVVVHDPVGGPVGVAVAEHLAGLGGRRGHRRPGPGHRHAAVADRRPGRRQRAAAAGRGAARASGAGPRGQPGQRAAGGRLDRRAAADPVRGAGRLRALAARRGPVRAAARHGPGGRLRRAPVRARGHPGGTPPGPDPGRAGSRQRGRPAGGHRAGRAVSGEL